jgi:hypothetical protein
MMGRVWTAYTVEVEKAIAQRQTFVGPLAVMVVIACLPWVHAVHRDPASAYAFVSYALPLVFTFLGFALLLAFVAGQTALELSCGTVRAVLVRPVLRHELLLAKALLGLTYGVLLLAGASLSAWLMAAVWGDLHGVHYGGELLFSHQQMRNAYLAGVLLSMAPVLAGVGYAMLCAMLSRSASGAVTLAIGGWLVLDGVKHPLGIEQFVFTTYLEWPWHAFSLQSMGMDAIWVSAAVFMCAGVCVLEGAFCFFLAVLIFRRRNLC